MKPTAPVIHATRCIAIAQFHGHVLPRGRIAAAPAGDYDAVLALVTDLGLRLANPCTERPGMDTLTTAGQETAFQRTQALVVATTTAASNVWLRQLHSTAGVVAITTPYAPACP